MGVFLFASPVKTGDTIDITTLENWLWEAACSIRGPLDAPKFRDYILPLLFYKRLCDVYEDEVKCLAEHLSGAKLAQQLTQPPRRFAEYVVVHELLHLRAPRHNGMYELLLGRYLPDWRERERALTGRVLTRCNREI
jgi:hypothetical protein